MANAPSILEATLRQLLSPAEKEMPARSRAAVALILRRSPSFAASDSPSGSIGQSPTPLDLLFIQRAVRQSDPWSAHIAFPGGRRDPTDESDVATAVRETAEELQLDLSNSAHYRFLGRLPDRRIRRSRRATTAALSAFVFLQLPSASGQTPQPQPTEVSVAFWAPLSALHGTTPATHELDVRSMPGPFRMFRPNRIQMPAVDVLALAEGLVYAPGERPPHALLWGMTLGCIGDLVDRLGGRRLDWPFALPGNLWLARLFVGCVDVYWWVRKRIWQRTHAQRRIAL